MRMRLIFVCAEGQAGDVVDVSASRARQLARGGVATSVTAPLAELPDGVDALGGGWYRLPDGTKVRGLDQVADGAT